MKKSTTLFLFTTLLAAAIQACNTPSTTQIPASISVTEAASEPAVASTPVPQFSGMPYIETDFNKVLSALQSGNFSYMENLAVEKYDTNAFLAPATLTYTISIPASEVVYLQYNWCAKDAATLQDNLQHISVSFRLNDQQIAQQNVIPLSSKADNGWECTSNGLLLSGWQPGNYQFSVLTTFDQAVNDGAIEFPAGDYIAEYSVTVQ